MKVNLVHREFSSIIIRKGIINVQNPWKKKNLKRNCCFGKLCSWPSLNYWMKKKLLARYKDSILYLFSSTICWVRVFRSHLSCQLVFCTRKSEQNHYRRFQSTSASCTALEVTGLQQMILEYLVDRNCGRFPWTCFHRIITESSYYYQHPPTLKVFNLPTSVYQSI